MRIIPTILGRGVVDKLKHKPTKQAQQKNADSLVGWAAGPLFLSPILSIYVG